MEDNLNNLIKLFERFPGIGSRQAKRFSEFIRTEQPSYVEELTRAISQARLQARTCESCLRVYSGQGSMCSLCSDSSRDTTKLLVVEKSSDIDAFARVGYDGVFFVLGGLIPIVQKSVLLGTNIQKLVERIEKTPTLTELILAFPLTPNGEHTDQVLREMLEQKVARITSLGRGLSTGTELEYADPVSLSASLKKRE